MEEDREIGEVRKEIIEMLYKIKSLKVMRYIKVYISEKFKGVF